MTREEAIQVLESMKSEESYNALIDLCNMAIESLRKDIERHEMVIRASERHLGIVRRKDCKYWHSNTEFCDVWSHMNIAQRTLVNDYCSHGERREP